MNIPIFRTQEFKNTILYIAEQKGYISGKIKYHFDLKGNIKPLTICKVKDEYIAHFTITYKDGNSTITTPIGISYNDYIQCDRDIKLSEVFGEKIQLKVARRVKDTKAPKFDLVVGKLYFLTNGHQADLCIEITKKTPKQYKYKYFSFTAMPVMSNTKEFTLRNDNGSWRSDAKFVREPGEKVKTKDDNYWEYCS